MTVVIDLTANEQTLKLRTPGFESCTVTAPDWLSDRQLWRFYRRPARACAPAFVDELLALCLMPRLRPQELAVLSASDRARLRRAVVAVHGRERQWRSLSGSHLTSDERLFAVMFWRWREQEDLRGLLRQRHSEHAAADAGEVGAGLVRRMGADLAVPHSPSTLMQLALHGPQPTVDISKFLASPVLPALTGYWSSAMFPSKMLKMFEDPAVGALQQFAKEMSGTTRVLTDLRATFPTVSVPSSFVNVVKPSGTVDALTAGVRIDSLLGLHGAGALASWATPPIAFGALAKLERTFASQITASFRSLVPDVSALKWPVASALAGITASLRALEPMRELMEAMGAVDRFERRWQQRALYYLVSTFFVVCSVWELTELAALTEEEVETVVLDALEAVAADGAFIAALRTEVGRAPHLNNTLREHLDDMLEHAEKGEWVRASGQLYPGLEGAFWEVAYAHTVVTEERKDPRNTNKAIGFETMVKRLAIEQEFKTFMVNALFGTTGNPYRHGGTASEHRRQVLLGMAALAGWFEQFTNVQALTALVRRSARALPAAIERGRMPALSPGD